jgi:fatty-acyl-CoA synthase
VTEQTLRDHLLERFPKWWLPEQFVFVREVPRTTTGKFDKVRLRERFSEEFGTLPTDE